MAIEDLARQASLVRAFANADANYATFVTTGDVANLNAAADRLCEAGNALLADDVFWEALRHEADQMNTDEMFAYLLDHKEEFLSWELEVLTHDANENKLSVPQASDLLAQVTEAIENIQTYSDAGRQIELVHYVEVLRTQFENLTTRVCEARWVQGDDRGALRRGAAWVWRHKKRIGGLSFAAVNGVAALWVPPLTPFFTRSSVTSGILAAL
jgi:hypothetical protein